MGEVVSLGELTTLIKSFKKQGKIVLAGGCFDILHPGHVFFLEKAKKAGQILVILLESDQKVKELKGINRPVYTQPERARILSALEAVDYVVMLPYLKFDREYDELIAKIKPDVIAATSKDTTLSHHRRSAKLIGARFKLVTKVIGDYSTSKILNF